MELVSAYLGLLVVMVLGLIGVQIERTLRQRYGGTWWQSAWQQLRQVDRAVWQHLVAVVLALSALWIIWDHWHPAMPPTPDAHDWNNIAWITLAAGMLLVAFSQAHRVFAPQPFALARSDTARISWYALPALIAGILILLRLTLLVTPQLEMFGLHSPIEDREEIMGRDSQMAWFLAAVVLLVVAFITPAEWRQLGRGLRYSLRRRWPEWLLVGCLTLLAFWARAYRLDTLIPVFHSDEPPFALRTLQLAEGYRRGLNGDLFFQQTYLGAFIGSYFNDLFGATLVGARLDVVLAGTLAIPGVYLMTRQVANPLAAILASLFLISQPVHIHFSRTDIYNIWDPTFAVFAVILLWHGLEKGGRWKFALAGLLVGLSQYFYTAARLYVILIGLWVLVIALRYPRKMWLHWKNLVIFAGLLTIALLPLFGSLEATGNTILDHSLAMSQGHGDASRAVPGTFDEYLQNWLRPALLVFFDRGDHSNHYDIHPHSAINLQAAFLVFMLGLAYGLRFALNSRVLFLLMWLGLGVFFGGSLTHYVGFTRYVTVLLPMAILAGLGLATLVQLLGRGLSRHYQPLLSAGAVLLMLLVSADNVRFALQTHPERLKNDLHEERWIADSLAHETLAVQDEGRVIWINGSKWNWRMLEVYGFYNEGDVYSLELRRAVRDDWLRSLDTTEQDIYIFIPPTDKDSPDPTRPPAEDSAYWKIADLYPEATITRFDGRVYPTLHPSALFARVRIPRQAEAGD
jgi:4-amino-4-deoxy-L-arabinose transferase-like glycosyltransferase